MRNIRELLEVVCIEHGIKPGAFYAEPQAAGMIHIDLATLRRWRRAELVPRIEMPNGGIRYLGIHVAAIILLGRNAKKYFDGLDDEIGSVEPNDDPKGGLGGACQSIKIESNGPSGSSGNDLTVPRSTAPGTTPARESSSALRLALQSLQRPKG